MALSSFVRAREVAVGEGRRMVGVIIVVKRTCPIMLKHDLTCALQKSDRWSLHFYYWEFY